MPNLGRRRFSHPTPSVRFPNGIGPPRKSVTGIRKMNGKVQYQFSYYPMFVPESCVESNGNDAELQFAIATCPEVRVPLEDEVDFDTYMKEQQGVIARVNEIIAAMDAIGERNQEWLKLLTELWENRARKDIPSKDWRPFQYTYKSKELRTPVAIGAPAIEAALPY